MSQLNKTTDHIKIDRNFVLLQIKIKTKNISFLKSGKKNKYIFKSFTIGKQHIRKRHCCSVQFIHFKILVYKTKLKITLRNFENNLQNSTF